MRTVQVTRQEAGQRLDKYLGKYLSLAPKSFFYKMLRKKNIVLNGKKAEGREMAVWLGALPALQKDPGQIPSNHMAAHNCLSLQYQGT